MFKLVVLSALLAVAVARPGHLHTSPLVYSAPLVHERSFENVGAIVKSVPTAVSWQRSSIVHHKDHVEPIVAPIVKTYAAAPIVKAVHTPLVHTYVAAEPWTVGAPLRSTFEREFASPIGHFPAPLSYAAAAPWTIAAPARSTFEHEFASPIGHLPAPLSYAAGW